MTFSHKIKKRVEINKFLEHIQEFEEKDIETSSHSFFRFSEKQRKVYNDKFVKNMLLHETPFLAGIQNNNLWTLFYKYSKEIWKVIINLKPNKIYIVTFYIIDEGQIPKI